jgi:type IV pilus assembly protein PilN
MMIKINLLPQKSYGQHGAHPDLVIFPAILVLTFALVGGVFLKNNRDVARLRIETAGLRTKIGSLQGIYKEFLTMEKERKEIAERIAVIDRIKEGRALAPRLLYDLSSLMTDNLWLKKVRKADTRIDIEGRSIDNESVCTFVEGLSRLSYMKNVELKSVEDVTETGTTVRKFVVEAGAAS